MSQTGVAPEQSVDAAHASHLPALAPAVMHTPSTHCADSVQPGWSWARPQTLPVASHTPLAQTRAPESGVHAPFTGACEGSGCPFDSLGEHCPAPGAPAGSSHHSPGAQSLSLVHLLPQAPDAGLQIGPEWVPAAHSLLSVHVAHSPVGAQYGSVELGQAWAAPDPLSPAQATQV